MINQSINDELVISVLCIFFFTFCIANLAQPTSATVQLIMAVPMKQFGVLTDRARMREETGVHGWRETETEAEERETEREGERRSIFRQGRQTRREKRELMRGAEVRKRVRCRRRQETERRITPCTVLCL